MRFRPKLVCGLYLASWGTAPECRVGRSIACWFHAFRRSDCWGRQQRPNDGLGGTRDDESAKVSADLNSAGSVQIVQSNFGRPQERDKWRVPCQATPEAALRVLYYAPSKQRVRSSVPSAPLYLSPDLRNDAHTQYII